MYRQSIPEPPLPGEQSPATDYQLTDGLVDVLADLFEATGDDLPPPLRLAQVWIRRHASNADHYAHCDEELIEALADIAAEARRGSTHEVDDLFGPEGVVLKLSGASR